MNKKYEKKGHDDTLQWCVNNKNGQIKENKKQGYDDTVVYGPSYYVAANR